MVLSNNDYVAPIAIYGSGGSPPFYNPTAYQKIYNYTPPYYYASNWYFAYPWLWMDGDKDAGWVVFSQSALHSMLTQRFAIPSALEIDIGGGVSPANDSLNLVFYIRNTGTQTIAGNFYGILTENNLSWSAPNGQQTHDFVPRLWWPDAVGWEVTILAGALQTVQVDWALDQNWVINELSVVAFVQSKLLQPDSTLEIYQGAKAKVSELTNITGDGSDNLADDFQLFQNYPNPFNPTTVISYQLAVSSSVKLEILNMAGQRVAILVNERLPAGYHSAEFDASGLASGVYLYRLEVDGYVLTRKMVLMK